jgi:hypothetical protein
MRRQKEDQQIDHKARAGGLEGQRAWASEGGLDRDHADDARDVLEDYHKTQPVLGCAGGPGLLHHWYRHPEHKLQG